MKVLLTTLNASYVHTSLALRYLRQVCRQDGYQVLLREYTINDHQDEIIAEIYRSGADLIAFSCYIWNITRILEIAEDLKKVKPDCIILLGGPEVSYDAQETLEQHNYIDYIITGEGVTAFSELINIVEHNTGKLQEISGLVYHENNQVKTAQGIRNDLNLMPFPYSAAEMKKLRNKILYYETSWGCPFNCSYCLSSASQGVCYLSLERVKQELLFFIKHKVKLLKFVDRTFNSNQKRAMEIFRFLLDNQGETSFHFEIDAGLLDEEMLDLFLEVPEGLFQLEIGVQSTNKETLKRINRSENLSKLTENVQILAEKSRIHLHLDLIAGLPGEDYHSIKQSVDDVFSLKPQHIQLGFLKLLKGTSIRREAREKSYKFSNRPPYQVLENDSLSYQQLIQLREMAELINKYYNSGVFSKSLVFIIGRFYQSSFRFFEKLADYFVSRQLNRISHSRVALYDILNDLFQKEIKEQSSIFREFLKYDLFLHNRGFKKPVWASRVEIPNLKQQRYKFLSQEDILTGYFPKLAGQSMGKILSLLDFEAFKIDVLRSNQQKIIRKEILVMFDYSTGSSYDVSEHFLLY